MNWFILHQCDVLFKFPEYRSNNNNNNNNNSIETLRKDENY